MSEYFCYDPAGGVTFHETPEAAKAKAENALQGHEESAADSDWHWGHETGDICWGVLLGRAVVDDRGLTAE